jgi:hypothetical protein
MPETPVSRPPVGRPGVIIILTLNSRRQGGVNREYGYFGRHAADR